jgi:hypothetical protein
VSVGFSRYDIQKNMMRRFGGLAGLSFLKRKTLRFFVAFNFLFTAAILGLDARAATSPPSKRGEIRSLASMVTFAAVYLAEGAAFLLFGARIIAAVGGRNDALKMSRMVFVCAGGLFALGVMMVIQAVPGALDVTHADRAFVLYSTGPKLVELVMCLYMLSAVRRVRGPTAWAKRTGATAKHAAAARPRAQRSVPWLLRRLGLRTSGPVRPPPRSLRVGLAQREPSVVATDEARGASLADSGAPLPEVLRAQARTPSVRNPMFHRQQGNPAGAAGPATSTDEGRPSLPTDGDGQGQAGSHSARPTLVDLIAHLSETILPGDSSSDDEGEEEEFEPPPDGTPAPGISEVIHSGRSASLVTPTPGPGRHPLTAPGPLFQHDSSSPGRSPLGSPASPGRVSSSRAKKLQPSVIASEEMDLTDEPDPDVPAGEGASFVNPILAAGGDAPKGDIPLSGERNMMI